MKKTILHIIQDLHLGGAETTVVGVLKNLPEYNNIVVTLKDGNGFGEDLKYDKYFSLRLRSYYLFLFYIPELKKIIKESKADIVHSHLYWSTIMARLACPGRIPLVTTIQSSVSDGFEYKKKWIRWLDRCTYKLKESIILGVSKYALHDYFSFLKIKPRKTGILYNYVDEKKFNNKTPFSKDEEKKSFRIISVGNLKLQKNQQFLLSVMSYFKDENIFLDIYGDGDLRHRLQKIIKEQNLPVRLMGKVRNINEIMYQYDLFIMSSFYEGFSVAVLEGMALQKPMLLSRIPTFVEQCADTAEYFDLNDVSDAVEKIKALKEDPEKLQLMAKRARERVLQNFTLGHHLKKLKDVYQHTLQAINATGK